MALFRRNTAVEDDEERSSLLGRIIRYLCYALILALYLLFFWRMCTRGDTALAKSYCWTDAGRTAYNESGGAMAVYQIDPVSEIGEATTKKKNSFAFGISSVYLTPAVSQLQFTLRYNDSMLTRLQAEYDLDAPPEGEAFVFVLADNLGTVYTEYQYLADERNVNNYRRLVFEELSFGEEITEYVVSVYYAGHVEIAKPLITLSVWQAGTELTPIEYSEPARTALRPRPAYTAIQAN